MSDPERGYVSFELRPEYREGQGCIDDPLYKEFSVGPFTLTSGPLDWGFICHRCGETHLGQGEAEMTAVLEGGQCVGKRVSLLHLVWSRLLHRT